MPTSALLVWDCHWPLASFAKLVAAVLTLARSALISFAAPFPAPACTCVSLSRDVRRAAASAHSAELAAETDGDAAAGDEDAPDAVLLLLDPHATVRSATPPAIAASRNRAGLATLPRDLMTASLPAGQMPAHHPWRGILREGPGSGFRSVRPA